jgi:RNA polymerase sigma-70 factor (ECF subfamily)
MNKSIDDRGRAARMARREEGAYSSYVTDEQRSQSGWIGRENERVIHSRALSSERTRREVALEWSEALAELPAPDPLVEQLRVRHAARVTDALRTACLDLPRRHRAVLRLLFVDGASVDEVAAMYAVHRVTV